MIPITFLENQKVVVFGLGKSGLSTARALKAGGAIPLLSDDSEKNLTEARAAGFDVVERANIKWDDCATLVLSPGVPLTHPEPHPVVIAAQQAGLDIVGDVELFFLERDKQSPTDRVIAITGTNGKSTTTALTAHMFEAIGEKVGMGGNIGIPVLDLPPFGTGHIYVLELSSFQIDLTPTLKPSVGILLNITEDHIDRHGSMAQYANVKEMLVEGADFAIIPIDDEWTQNIAKKLAQRGKPMLAAQSESFAANLQGHPVLKGAHNIQNAMCAFAAGWHLGFEPQKLIEAIFSFRGLAHRMEPLGEIAGVSFINDSKATNADSAEKALNAFDDIFWILGGKAKTGGIEVLAPLFPKVRKAFLIGDAAEEFAKTLDAHELPYTISKTMAQAVEDAFQSARESNATHPTVLLSPACASFDQYRSFEERGDHFRQLVNNLKQGA